MSAVISETGAADPAIYFNPNDFWQRCQSPLAYYTTCAQRTLHSSNVL